MNRPQVVLVGEKNKQAIAVRRNELMLGSYRLSVWAQRVFLQIISEVKDEHTAETPYELPLATLARDVGIEDGNLYREMWGIVRELADTYVQVDSIDEPGKPVMVGLIVNRVKPRVDKERERTYTGGSFVVNLHADLLPYVKRLTERFTKVELKYAFRLRSTFSQRMYDILKTQEFHGRNFEVELADLRKMLAMKATDMARFPDFRRFVLEKACAEINERTDLHVTYQAIKSGNKVECVGFKVRTRKPQETGRQVDFLAGSLVDDLYRRLTKAGLSASEAKKIVSQWGKTDSERIVWHLKELARKIAAGEIKKSPVAWLRAGLKADYRPQGSLFSPSEQAEERKAEQQELAREADLRKRPPGPAKGVRTVAEIMKDIADPKLKEALDRMAVGVQKKSA